MTEFLAAQARMFTLLSAGTHSNLATFGYAAHLTIIFWPVVLTAVFTAVNLIICVCCCCCGRHKHSHSHSKTSPNNADQKQVPLALLTSGGYQAKWHTEKRLGKRKYSLIIFIINNPN